MYYSRAYIAEKWDKLKIDIEGVLDIYTGDKGDKIPEEDVEKVKHNVKDLMKSIMNELGIE